MKKPTEEYERQKFDGERAKLVNHLSDYGNDNQREKFLIPLYVILLIGAIAFSVLKVIL